MRALLLGVLWYSAILLAAAGKADETPTGAVQIKKLNSSLLPNLVIVRDGIYSGGQPEGEAAFEALRELGVRTLISVDGAKPDVDLANKFDLHYVHLPHGYDGVPPQRVKELAKALQSLDGPFYIHCHHGKHRSPVAAAVACRTLGWLNASEAARLLAIAGTDPRYQGLYRSVESAQPIATSELETVPSDFPSIAKLPPMAELMVDIEKHFNHLETLQQQTWSIKETKEASVQSALLLFEQYRELQRIDDPRSKATEFTKRSRASEEAALAIERLLSSGANDGDSIRKLDQAMKVVKSNCTACHQLVRN